MAKSWRQIIESEEYQSGNFLKKMIAKRNYWDTIITQSDKFGGYPDETKKEIEDWFFTEREEEGFVRGPLGTMIPKEPMANLPLVKMFQFGDKKMEQLSEFIHNQPVPQNKEYLKKAKGVLSEELYNKVEDFEINKVPKISSFAKNFVGDMVGFYKPSTLLAWTAGGKTLGLGGKAIAKAYKKIPEPIRKGIYQKVGKPLAKFFTIGKGRPKEYVKALDTAKLEKLVGAREAGIVGEVLSTEPFTKKALSLKQQRIVGKIFRGEAETIRHLPKYSKYSSIAKEGRLIQDSWSKALIKSGIPTKEAKETIETNIGNYMARMYTEHFTKKKVGAFGLKSLRLRLNSLKHRKDLSTEVQKQLGVIKEPALPTAIRVKELSASIANNKVFQKVALNPEWSATTNVTGNMIKMADDKAWGALRGKYVVPEIAEDINAIIATTPQAQSLYMRGLSAWKFGKVVFNPATHSRNIMSNSMLLDLSGVSHFRQAELYPKVIEEYLKKGPLYQQALKSGAIGGEFVGGEVAKIRMFYEAGKGGNFSKILNTLKIPAKRAGGLYQAEEQINKMVKFVDVLEKGGAVELAAREAQKWGFDYTKIPRFIEIAKHGIPFITFTYKALPRIAETLVTNPLKIYKYQALFKSWNEASRKQMGMSAEDFARHEKALPPWQLRNIGGMPANVLLPFKDKYGRSQWLNVEYILPVGMAPEAFQRGPMRGLISNPFITLTADLTKNQDFRGRPIVPPEATPQERTKAIAQHMYKVLAPSLAPAVGGLEGGYSFEKIMDAIHKRPVRGFSPERKKELTPTLLDTLIGIKISSVDVEESEMYKMFEKQKIINDLTSQAHQIIRDPRTSDEDKEKEIEQIFIKMQTVLEK